MGSDLLWFQELNSVFCPKADGVANIKEFVAVGLGSRFAGFRRQDVGDPLLMIDQQIPKAIKNLGLLGETLFLPDGLCLSGFPYGLGYILCGCHSQFGDFFRGRRALYLDQISVH